MTRIAIITALLSLCLTGCEVAHAADTLTRTYNLGATPRVKLGNINGPISVTGSARTSVYLSAVKQGGSAAQRARLKIEIEVRGDTLAVRTRCERWIRGCGQGVQVRYTLHIPRGARLSCRSVNGAVTVAGVQGEVSARTVNGKIRTSDTGSAALKARAVNGKIEVSGHAGPVKAHTVSGPIRLELKRLAGEVQIRTVSGSARVKMPKTSGASVDLSTVSGSLVSQLPLQVERRGRRGLSGTLGQGGPQVRARTVSGSVTLEAL